MITTAGNVDFTETVGDAKVDKIEVSCDGADQNSYEKYRKNGDFEKVIKFMRDCKKYGSCQTYLVWKYILFEFNDSDENILNAQRIADDIGVDSILFVITNSKWNSKRFSIENIHEIPIHSLVASVLPAAALMAISINCRLIPVANSEIIGVGYIDKCSVTVGKFLIVEGWAFQNDGNYASLVKLCLDGNVHAQSKTVLIRHDVFDQHPKFAGTKCGFRFSIPINPNSLPSLIEIKVFGSSNTTILGGNAIWIYPNNRIKNRIDLSSSNFN